MKRGAFLFGVLAAASVGATPTVTVDSVTQDAVTRMVTVNYTLGGEAAAVTADMQINGTSVATAHTAGEINRKLAPGSHAFTWAPANDGDVKAAAEGLVAVVKAWSDDNPPPYLAVELLPPRAISYYASADAIPGGVRSEECRTTRLVLRRIPAKNVVWTMGAPRGEAGQTSANAENQHNVKFTSDYYLGVYPVTQKQYVLIRGITKSEDEPFNFKSSVQHPQRGLYPAEGIRYVDLRGPTETYNWPATARGVVASDGFLGVLRTDTGLDFDLPTDAEWEYACRAGTAEALSSGKAYTEANLSELGWFKSTENPPGSPQPVGLKRPNAWGLYDMHGNVYEWCLDWYKEKLAPAVEPEENPVGPLQANSTGNRVLRGGSYTAAGDRARSAYRYNYNAPEKASVQTGFRLWCPAVVK